MAYEVFGNSEQQAMQRRGEALFRLLGNDTRFCSHGRGVQVADYLGERETVELTTTLARIVGISGCEMIPKENVEAFVSAVEGLGFKTDRYLNYLGAADVIGAARDTLAKLRLPEDLTLRVIEDQSPPDWLDALADVALSQGVLPSAGSVLRGITRPGFGMVAMDQSNRPVASACASLARHRDHPDHAMAQWGQLATRDDRKGQGIARLMAAHSIVHAADSLGTRVFSTGIRQGNLPSERLCRSFGLQPSGYVIVIVIDPLSFSGDRATK